MAAFGSVWTYPWDVADEGVETALRCLAEEGGMRGISLTHVYHHVKALAPHNPKRKLFITPSGAVYFQPDKHRYKRIQPVVDPLVESADVPRLVREAAARFGMEYHAWVVCLHSTTLGTRHPTASLENAFGDRVPHYLCPANPDVREYVTALLSDIADNLGPQSVELEFLHYGGFTHATHHEHIGVPLDDYVTYLLGLCFCASCLAHAQEVGVDGSEVRAWARAQVTAFFAGDDPPSTRSLSDLLLETALTLPAVRGYLDMRRECVMSLWRECKQALHGKVRFTPIANMGSEPDALYGIDMVQALDHGICDEVLDLNGYHLAGPPLARATHDFQRLVAGRVPIRAGLRLLPPQVVTSADVAGRVQVLRSLGIERFNFYNYGLMRLANLRAAKEALA